MKTLGKLGIGVVIAAVVILGIASIFGKEVADTRTSEQGAISGEPFTLTPDPDAEDRAYPDEKNQFLVPELGIRAPLQEPENGEQPWHKRYHADSWAAADFYSQDHTPGGPIAVVTLNARGGHDALGNPLVTPETQEPRAAEGTIFVVDGVEYALTDTHKVAIEDIVVDQEPITQEVGKLLAVVYLIGEDTQPSGEAIIYTLHRTAAQDHPASRFAQ